MKHIYGPVQSRRLGYSLGVSLLPHKVCTFDCVYCQLGATTTHTDKRKEYTKADEIISEVTDWMKEHSGTPKNLDYITLSGSGEPLLHLNVKAIIDKIKELTNVPVAVITNGFFLADKNVRASLLGADLIIPSLDAVTQEEFEKIDRPVKKVEVYDIIKGLIHLRKEFKGKIWLEIMLVKGINDGIDYIKHFKPVVSRINPDKVQLNTPVRSPELRSKSVPDKKTLEKIKRALGEKCEII